METPVQTTYRQRIRFWGTTVLSILSVLLFSEAPSHAVIIPDGWDDAPYVEFGKQYETNLLSIRIFGTDPATGEIRYAANASATYLNNRFALTAGHIFAGFPNGSKLTAEVATGSNMVTNRGIVIQVAKFFTYPTYDYHNPPDPLNGVYVPDVAILCLASNLAGPQILITNATDGEIVTQAGFGDSGTPATGLTFDKNSRAWNAPVDSFMTSALNPDYYTATRFYPYIAMNGRGANRDSGGPITKLGDQNSLIGICFGGNAGVSGSGFGYYLDLSNPDIKSWIEANTSLTPSLSIAPDETLSLTGNTNLLYGLQASTNLVDWTEIATLTNVTGTVNYHDTNAGNDSSRYYRAVVK